MVFFIFEQEKVEHNNKCSSGSEKVNLQVVLQLKYTKTLTSFLSVSDSEPEYSYKLYSYKKCVVGQMVKRPPQGSVKTYSWHQGCK